MHKSILLLLLVFCLGCKKTKLEGDLAVLVGEWEWVQTRKLDANDCSNYLYQTPTSEGYTFFIKFLSSGKLELYKNNSSM